MAARVLATPAKTGTLITIPDLAEVARRTGIPLATRGTREWIIEEMLRTAYDYGVLDRVCEELMKLIERRASRLKSLVGDDEFSELFDWVTRGVEEAQRVLRLLADVYRESKTSSTS
jgi:hypothetical protein